MKIGDILIEDTRYGWEYKYKLYMTKHQKKGVTVTSAIKKEEDVDEIINFINTVRLLEKEINGLNISLEDSHVCIGDMWSNEKRPAIRLRIVLPYNKIRYLINKLKSIDEVIFKSYSLKFTFNKTFKEIKEEYNEFIMEEL